MGPLIFLEIGGFYEECDSNDDGGGGFVCDAWLDGAGTGRRSGGRYRNVQGRGVLDGRKQAGRVPGTPGSEGLVCGFGWWSGGSGQPGEAHGSCNYDCCSGGCRGSGSNCEAIGSEDDDCSQYDACSWRRAGDGLG